MITDAKSVALAEAFKSVALRVPGLQWAAFDAVAARCEVHPVIVGGEIAGAVLVDGPELHACVMPWAIRRWMRKSHLALIDSVIAKHGKAVTSATTEAGRQFVLRLGFVPDGEKYVKVNHGL